MPGYTVDNTARAEDVAWMAETGETVLGAAYRLGISRAALEKWCDKHGMRAAYRRLQANGRAA